MWCQISINFWRMIIYFFTTSTCIIILQANPSSQIYNPWDYRREDVPNVEISWGQCLESRHRRELFDCGGSNFSPERGTGRRTRWKLSSHMTLSLATIYRRWPMCDSHQFLWTQNCGLRRWQQYRQDCLIWEGGSNFSPERGAARGKLLSHMMSSLATRQRKIVWLGKLKSSLEIGMGRGIMIHLLKPHYRERPTRGSRWKLLMHQTVFLAMTWWT